jgi:Tfp pilus assembly protein PilE
MIVIAIIGILAAIAIPNFMTYRAKGYCSAVQSDAKSVAAAVADYFSDPNVKAVNSTTNLDDYTLSYDNTITTISTDGSNVVTITIDDGTDRCPEGSRYTIFIGGDKEAYWAP